MEVIVYLLLGALAIYLICLFVVYVVLPVASIVATATVAASVGYALIVSIISFAASIKDNIHPYEGYVDKRTNAPPGVRRNYFFGPGFHQMSEIIGDAFDHLTFYRGKLKAWKDRALFEKWYVDMWIYIGYFLAVFNAQVLGFIWVLIFSVILATVLLSGMCFFFLFFSLLWLTDRITLLVKSIHNRCPRCKRKSVIPVFMCPSCGTGHTKLVPGPYGVLKRKCSCGEKLSTTFLGGRSNYEAHCPFCDTELLSSSSKQYGIQLVGGISTGKTTFLAAFWHEYKQWLQNRQDISFRPTPEESFEDLEDWFHRGTSEATLETNASMYSIIHAIGNTSVQMTIYDIAGEVFDFAESETQQQQFRYCEGFLLVIDPTGNPETISGNVANFVNSIAEIRGKRASKTSSVPVAIIISKSDLFKKEIGLSHIKAAFARINDGIVDPAVPPLSKEQHQDNVCREFLLNHGYDNSVNLLESEFSNIRYFPVSSMGHKTGAGEYEPWGVLEPVFWLMGDEKCPLRHIIHQSE